ncbi:MAG TPA: hypothetical protein VGS57_22210, partial [Thermoanaerobaculia bacterium]|nr:hypothetical protein [Thermoanaerobaculia bacterium]
MLASELSLLHERVELRDARPYALLAQRRRLTLEEAALLALRHAQPCGLALLADYRVAAQLCAPGGTVERRDVPMVGACVVADRDSGRVLLHTSRTLRGVGQSAIDPKPLPLRTRHVPLRPHLLVFGTHDVALRAHLL